MANKKDLKIEALSLMLEALYYRLKAGEPKESLLSFIEIESFLMACGRDDQVVEDLKKHVYNYKMLDKQGEEKNGGEKSEG